MKNIKSFENGLRIEPRSDSAVSQEGEVEVYSNSLRIYVQAAARTLATLDQTQTFTHKSMSGSDNTFSNIPYSAIVFSGGIVNADIAANAAIAYSKLATLSSGNILVGSAGGVATSVAMSGESTIINTGAVTLSNSAVIGKVLTGYVSGAGTVAATDTILQAIQKLNGNDSNQANRALSNLASVAINTHLLPTADDAINLGSTTFSFLNVYASTVYNSLGEGVISLAAKRLLSGGDTSFAWGNLENTSYLDLVPVSDVTFNLGGVTEHWHTTYTGAVQYGTNRIIDLTSATIEDTSGDSIDWTNRELKTGATVKLDWSGTNIDVNTRKIINVVDPTADQDVATKKYVDDNSTAFPGATTELEYSENWGDDTYGLRGIADDADILANGDAYSFGSTNATTGAMTTPFVLIEAGSNVGNGGGATGAVGGVYISGGYADGVSTSGEISLKSGRKTASSTAGNSGTVDISSGDVDAGSGNSGSVSLVTGTSINGDSGSIAINTGSAGGTRGLIDLNALFARFRSATPLRFEGDNNTNYIAIQPPSGLAVDYTITLPDAAPAANTTLTYDGADYVWSAAGVGDVVGPASSVDGEVALFDLTTGKLLKRATGTGVAHLTSGVLSASAVVLTSEVSGTLPIANGGTNSTATATAGGVAYGTGTAYAFTPVGTMGQTLKSTAAGSPLFVSLPAPIITTHTASTTYYRAFWFTCASASATAGATYTNNGITFTVIRTIASGTQLLARAGAAGSPTATGTLTKSAGTGDATITYVAAQEPSYIKATVVGGGGASGGSAATAALEFSEGAGGGGGGCAIRTIPITTIGASETITVGGGGAAGAAGAAGNAGASSSFGSLLSATGGGGGAASAASSANADALAGNGGVGSGGDLNFNGGAGGHGVIVLGRPLYYTFGGDSYFAGVNRAVLANDTNGEPGGAYGQGASGSRTDPGSGANAGSAGGAGVVLIEEFYQ